ncbi:MAG: site-2 protease family protein [Pirellulaceae bacterium]|jgi:Zn-dependent protease|nr:site-2 protease family protein [Pirellulaceae bacterium]MDP7015477.1 site-2 protease family protein [Pirellulaceae bacterium]
MKRGSWKLGELSGIGVYVHWSFAILPVWIGLSALGAGAGLFGAIDAVFFIFALFGCVVLHEMGHALMARRFGIGTRDITLYPIGGVASLERIPERPAQELAIALAGPAVNMVIAGVLFVGMLISGSLSSSIALNPMLNPFFTNLLIANVALVVFNMLPAFPMDGGRVLRSLLALRMPYLRATEIATLTGQMVAILFGLIGLFSGGLSLLLIAVFVYFAATAELNMTRMRYSSPFIHATQPDGSVVEIWDDAKMSASEFAFRSRHGLFRDGFSGDGQRPST